MTGATRSTAAPSTGTRLRPGLCAPVLFIYASVAGTISYAQEPSPTWSDVAALFEKRCVMCHSGVHAASDLKLDSYTGALSGSRSGPVLIAGNVSASELIRRIRGESQPRMPFLSYPLAADEMALLERWIEAGLPEAPPEITPSLHTSDYFHQ